MKRKFKLITAVASLSLAIIFLGMGIYAAATDRQVGINGTITIKAERVAATVTVKQKYGNDAFAPIGSAIQFKIDSEANQARGTKQLGDAEGKIALSEAQTVYAFQVSIKNDFTQEVSIGVKLGTADLGANQAGFAVQQSFKIGATDQTPDETNGFVVAKGETLDMTFTYTITPANLPGGSIADIPLVLELELVRI